MSDQLSNGQRFRVLTVIDTYSRECLAISVGLSFPATRVTEILDQIVNLRGKPEWLSTDNGSDFTSTHFDA